MSLDSKKNIGLIGVGYWGKNLLRVFSELDVLKTVCDLNKKNLEEAQKEFSTIKTTDNFKDIFDDKDIKAIVIATPAVTHYDLAKKALLAGKDVFVEKPLALKVKEGEELVELACRKKLILMVGHLLLYHPAIIELKKLIKNGTLGNIRYIYSDRLNFGKLRTEENVLWSFAPHDVSVILDILGMPEKVKAVGRAYLQAKISDVTMSILEFKKNQQAHIFVSWLNPIKEQKLCVIGSKAMIIFNDQWKDKLMIYNHKVNFTSDGCLKAIKAEGEIIKISDKEPLLEEAKHFLNCVKNRKNPKTDGKEGLDVLKILNACQKSIEKDGLKIKL